MASYTWNITDKALLQQVKTAKNGKEFESPLFNAFNHRWYLRLAPNGTSSKKQGNVLLWLHIASLSPKVQSLRVRRTQSFVEGDFSDDHTETLKQDDMYVASWSIGAVKTADLQKHNQLTFKVEFDILGANDQDDKSIMRQFQASEMKIDDEGLRKEKESLKVESLRTCNAAEFE